MPEPEKSISPYSFCEILLQRLKRLGVNYFILCPGARNSLLLHAITKKNHPHFTHFDERSAAFFALGYNKKKIDKNNWKDLACVVTTSGSAVANTYPAVIEATESETPLFILSADRPKSLHKKRANQTTEQKKILSNHALTSIHLECKNGNFSEKHLKKLGKKIFDLRGVVHLNIAFSEPFLFESTQKTKNKMEKKDDFIFHGQRIFYNREKLLKKEKKKATKAAEYIKKTIVQTNKKKGNCLIVVGECTSTESKQLSQVLKKCPYEILLDICSPLGFFLSPDGVSTKKNQEKIIFNHQIYFDEMLKQKICWPIETIFHFGGQFISKGLAQYLKENRPKNYIHIEAPRRKKKYNPNDFISKSFHCDYGYLAPVLQKIFTAQKKINTNLFDAAQKNNLMAMNNLNGFSELSFMFRFLEKSNEIKEKKTLFIGNSMPIRLADIYPKRHGFGEIFYNRGISGIDGLIATICGVAVENENKKVMGIIGDLCALHDLGSFLLLPALQKKWKKLSISIIIINNQEGTIFRQINLLKSFQQNDNQKSALLCTHDHQFSSAAKMINAEYKIIANQNEIEAALSWVFSAGIKILEVRIDAKKSHLLHEKYCQKTKNSFLKAFLKK